MIAFLKKLWLAKHAHIDLRGDLIRVFRLMLAIPPANRLHVSAEVVEELRRVTEMWLPTRGDRSPYPAARGGLAVRALRARRRRTSRGLHGTTASRNSYAVSMFCRTVSLKSSRREFSTALIAGK